METFLRCFLPKLLTKTAFEVYAHQSKHQMLDRLPARLRGYSKFLPDKTRVVVLMDRDRENCYELKARLEKIGRKASLITKSRAQSDRFQIVNRIVVEELESWFFGDWPAVCAAYPKLSPNVPAKSAYRDPERINGAAWEAFERVMKRAGYFKGGLRKIEAAQNIAPHMSIGLNKCRSFHVFCEALASFETDK